MCMPVVFNPADHVNSVQFLLGSKSPRRRQLIQMLDIEVDSITIDADESFPSDMNSSEVAEFLAVEKSNAFSGSLEGKVLITADTTVVIHGEVLNKPADRSEAIAMLQKLSDDKHQVYTGICLRSSTDQVSFTDVTDVFFKPLTQREIEHYVDHYEPYDKAGAYGIQEWIGTVAVNKIDGCYYNVMGLPTAKLYKELWTFVNKNF